MNILLNLLFALGSFQTDEQALMVSTKVQIVDVSAVLHERCAVLRAVKAQYPSIEVYHRHRSHRVHISAHPTVQINIAYASNYVQAVAGEPFHFDSEMAARFRILLMRLPRDEINSHLAGVFHVGEKLVSDEPRLGWDVSGPVYGVCASTPQRRQEIMNACVTKLNSVYGMSLSLVQRSEATMDAWNVNPRNSTWTGHCITPPRNNIFVSPTTPSRTTPWSYHWPPSETTSGAPPFAPQHAPQQHFPSAGSPRRECTNAFAFLQLNAYEFNPRL